MKCFILNTVIGFHLCEAETHLTTKKKDYISFNMVKNWAKFPNELHGFQYALGHNAKFTMVTDSSSFEGIYHEAIFYKWYRWLFELLLLQYFKM